MTNASRQVDAFERHYKKSPGHTALAYHAAFPLALTPDMLYRLAAYFQTDCEGLPLRIPWIAVADILLSPLCEEIDEELYEMVPNVRAELLRRLEAHERFGPARLKQLADFLLAYAQQHLHRHNPALTGRDLSTVREAQMMVAHANSRPDLAVEQLAVALATADLKNNASLIRYSRLTEELAQAAPMQRADGVEQVRLYAQGLEQIGRNNPNAAARRFAEAAGGRMEVQVGALSLPIPVQAHRGLNFPEFFLYNPVEGDTEIITRFGDLLTDTEERSEGIRIARRRDGSSAETPPFVSMAQQSTGAAQSQVNIGSMEGNTGRTRQRPLVILAAQRGVVDQVNTDPAHRLGTYIRIRHDWPAGDSSTVWYTLYCDLLNVYVTEGEFALPNRQIGTVGTFEANALRFIVQHRGAGLSGYALEDVVDPEPLFFEGEEPPVVDECRVISAESQTAEADQRITMRWTVENIGNTVWDGGYNFAFAGGDRMEGPDSRRIDGTVGPGERLAVELPLIAPENPGRYRGVWRPRTPNGFFFPSALTAEVEVTAEMPTMDGMVVEDTETEILKGQVGGKGYEFEVTWRLRNIGLRAWNSSFTLSQTTPTPLRAGYNYRYSAKSSSGTGRENILGAELTEIHMPEVEPGDEMVLTIPFTAPETEGFFESKWQLFNPEGRATGEKLIASASVGTAVKYTDLGLLLSDSAEVGERLIQELAVLNPYVMKIYSLVPPSIAHRLAADYPKARWIIQPYTDYPTTPRELVSQTLSQIKALVDALAGREVWIELDNEPTLPSQPYGLAKYSGNDFAKWFLEVKGHFQETLGPDVRFIYPSQAHGLEAIEAKSFKNVTFELNRPVELAFLEESIPALDEADAIGKRFEWSDLESMNKALDRLDEVLNRFPEKPIWVTLANNYNPQLPPQERAQQYVGLWRQLQKRPQVEGVVFFLGQSGDPELEPVTWAGKGIAEIVGRRYDDAAGLVEDVRMRFGGTAAVGERVTKEWRIQNIGRSTWNNDYRLVVADGEGWKGAASYSTHVSGRTGDEDEIFNFSSGYLGETDSQMTLTAVPMPDVAPGEIVIISLSLDVPAAPGGYSQTWQLFNEHNLAFGEKWRFDVSAVEQGLLNIESHVDLLDILADGYVLVNGDIIGRDQIVTYYYLDQQLIGAIRELDKLIEERLPEIGRRIIERQPTEGTAGTIAFDGTGPLLINGDLIFRDKVQYKVIFPGSPYDPENQYERMAVERLESVVKQLELLERLWQNPIPESPLPDEREYLEELVVHGSIQKNVMIFGQGGRTEINGDIVNPIGPLGLVSFDQAGDVLINGDLVLGDAVSLEIVGEEEFERLKVSAEPQTLSLESLLRRVDELEKRIEAGRTTKPEDDFQAQEQALEDLVEQPFDNFDLRVRKEGERYFIRAVYAQGGEAESAVYGEDLSENELVRSLLINLDSSTSGPLQVREVGQFMRDWLFPPPIWSFFVSAQMNSRERHNRGLRIRLQIEPPEIEMLPWEYCFDESFEYLALHRDMRLVRYQSLQQPYIPDYVSSPHPKRMLLAVAGPTELEPFDVDAETEKIFQALQPLLRTGDLEINRLDHATLDGLYSELAGFQPHILHFIGHSLFNREREESTLTLENVDGTAHLVSASQLVSIVRGNELRVILLSAVKHATPAGGNSFMLLARALVRSEIPAAIAVPYALPDETAVHFTRQFYQNMVRSSPIDRAITEARINTIPYDDTYWGVPVLFMRAQDGRIWLERAEEFNQM